MGHLITIVILLAVATIATGVVLPVIDRFDGTDDEDDPRSDEIDPRAAELAIGR